MDNCQWNLNNGAWFDPQAYLYLVLQASLGFAIFTFPSQWCGIGTSCIVRQVAGSQIWFSPLLVAFCMGECSTHPFIHGLLRFGIVIILQRSISAPQLFRVVCNHKAVYYLRSKMKNWDQKSFSTSKFAYYKHPNVHFCFSFSIFLEPKVESEVTFKWSKKKNEKRLLHNASSPNLNLK